MHALLVQTGFHRHPDPPENLRRFAERESFAEALRQMMVRVDKSRHQQSAWQRQRREPGMSCANHFARADIREPSARDNDGMAFNRAGRQHELLRQQQKGLGGQCIRCELACGEAHGNAAGTAAAVGAVRLNSWLNATATSVPVASPLPRMICNVVGNWPYRPGTRIGSNPMANAIARVNRLPGT